MAEILDINEIIVVNFTKNWNNINTHLEEYLVRFWYLDLFWLEFSSNGPKYRTNRRTNGPLKHGNLQPAVAAAHLTISLTFPIHFSVDNPRKAKRHLKTNLPINIVAFFKGISFGQSTEFFEEDVIQRPTNIGDVLEILIKASYLAVGLS